MFHQKQNFIISHIRAKLFPWHMRVYYGRLFDSLFMEMHFSNAWMLNTLHVILLLFVPMAIFFFQMLIQCAMRQCNPQFSLNWAIQKYKAILRHCIAQIFSFLGRPLNKVGRPNHGYASGLDVCEDIGYNRFCLTWHNMNMTQLIM